jgi:hypothetical protein
MPLLENQMESMVGEEQFLYLTEEQQQGRTGVVYKQLFPQNKNHIQTDFDDKQDLFRAVKYSCMFPFFTTNYPFVIGSGGGGGGGGRRKDDTDMDTDMGTTTTTATGGLSLPSSSSSSSSSLRLTLPTLKLPEIYVDGYFTTPRDQFGCPYLHNAGDDTGNNPDRYNPFGCDRTVAVSCLPQMEVGLTGYSPNDCISPDLQLITGEEDPAVLNESFTSIGNLLRLATQPSSKKELYQLYELGYTNTQTWLLLQEQ